MMEEARGERDEGAAGRRARRRQYCLCLFEACSKTASYGVPGSRRREFCFKHAPAGMANLSSPKCTHPGCPTIPSYGIPGTRKMEFCSKHANEGMVNLKSKMCGHPGCRKQPCMGVAGSKNREFCVNHAPEGMVSLIFKKCKYFECPKQPTRGVPNSRKAEYCAAHAPEGMVNTRKRKCRYEGCEKYAIYGVAGTGKPLNCTTHSEVGMVNLISMFCKRKGCNTQASYGLAGSKKEYCAKHAQKGMVNLKYKKCSRKGCTNQSSFGDPESGKGEYCAAHAIPGMLCFAQMCTHDRCKKLRSPFVAIVKRESRTAHDKNRMVNLATKCAYQGCMVLPSVGASSGGKNTAYCAEYAFNGLVPMRYKKTHDCRRGGDTTETRTVGQRPNDDKTHKRKEPEASAGITDGGMRLVVAGKRSRRVGSRGTGVQGGSLASESAVTPPVAKIKF